MKSRDARPKKSSPVATANDFFSVAARSVGLEDELLLLLLFLVKERIWVRREMVRRWVWLGFGEERKEGLEGESKREESEGAMKLGEESLLAPLQKRSEK